MYRQAELVFILQYYLASKSFVAVREAFGNNTAIKPAGNKISGHRKYSYLHVAINHLATTQLKFQPYQFQAVHQLQHRDTATLYCYLFRHFVREGIHV
jgi:hypothetical protein